MTADMWAAAIEDYCAWLRAAGAAAGTIHLRGHYVKRLARTATVGPWEVAQDDLIRMVAVDHWAPETRKSARSALRGFYAWAVEAGHIAADPSLKLPPVRVPNGRPRPTPRAVVVDALKQASPSGRLMIQLAVLAGLRRSEIAQVHTRDITPDLIGYSLRVHGKGGKVREVPLHPDLADALLRLPPGFVFPGRDRGHLSPGWVGKQLTRMLGAGWSGHTLRHRFATEAYAVERDLFAVQRLLGHSKPETTARYTAVPNDSLRAAVNGMAWVA